MNRFTLSSLSAGLLLAALAAGAQAVEVTQATDMVKGRAPEASNVAVSNQSSPGARLAPSNVASASYSFSDADGDAESGTTIQWLRNGSPISGATSATYTIQAMDNGTRLSVQITPRTNAVSTNPDMGMPIASAEQGVGVIIGDFLAPDTVLRTWSTAENYCQSRGARLPTRDELQQLFVNATSANVADGGQANTEMCSLYGWPLGGQCGGSYNDYWSSTSNGTGTHTSVGMANGGTYNFSDASSRPVACVR